MVCPVYFGRIHPPSSVRLKGYVKPARESKDAKSTGFGRKDHASVLEAYDIAIGPPQMLRAETLLQIREGRCTI